MRRAITREATPFPDWQSGRSSTHCNGYMLEHQLDCDVTFEVGQSKEIIRAHSYILKSRSQTLFQILSSPALETPYTIPLSSATPEDLKCVLRYCYTDMSNLTIDTVIGVLRLCKAFKIGALRDNCTAFIRSHLSDNNVCHFLEQAHHHQEEDLGNTCVELALNHGETVIRSHGFLQLCDVCVERIITRDSLRAREVTVYKRLLDWARTRQDNTNISDRSLRNRLGELLYGIRFPLLGLNYFTSQIAHRDLLTDAEKVSIFRYLTGADRSAGQFGTVRRVDSPVALTPDTRTCVRFSNTVGPLGDEILANTDANRRLGLALSCNRLVALRGLLLYRGRRAEYAVTVQLFSHLGDVLHEETVQLTTSEGRETTSIEFGRSVVLEPDLIYVLSVQTASYNRYYGAGGAIQVRNGEEIFTFYECPFPDHSSSLSQGDLPGILYSADTG